VRPNGSFVYDHASVYNENNSATGAPRSSREREYR
jgi:hypothetical protein